jgi:hypothetical protein
MTLLSPGQEIKEKSFTATIGRVSGSRGATVGKAQWGPAFEIIQIVDEGDAVNQIGVPDDYTYPTFFSITNFLKYSNDCRFVRIVDPLTSKNASPIYNRAVVDVTNDGEGYQIGDAASVSVDGTGVYQVEIINITGTPTGDTTTFHGETITIADQQEEEITVTGSTDSNVGLTVKGVAIPDIVSNDTGTTVAALITTELDALAYTATRVDNKITLTYDAYGPQTQTPTVNQNGISVATTVLTLGVAPVQQSETITVTGGCTTNGSLSLSYVGDNTPMGVSVTAGQTTNQVAQAIKDQLDANSDFTDVSVTANQVFYTYVNAGPKSPKLVVNVSTTGVSANSVITTAGVTGVQQVERLTVTGTANLTFTVGPVTFTAATGLNDAAFATALNAALSGSGYFTSSVLSTTVTFTYVSYGEKTAQETQTTNGVTLTASLNTAGYITSNTDIATAMATALGSLQRHTPIGSTIRHTRYFIGPQTPWDSEVSNGISFVVSIQVPGVADTLLITTGKVTNDSPLEIYIPTADLVAYDPDLTYTIVLSDQNGTGGAATVTVERESNVYFPNDNLAEQALSNGDLIDQMVDLQLPTIFARYPGAYGDDVAVTVISYADYVAYNGKNLKVPVSNLGGTSTIPMGVFNNSGPQTSNQYGILVKYKDEIVEKFVVSTNASDKDIYGSSIFIDDFFIKGKSKYIQATSASWPTPSTLVDQGSGEVFVTSMEYKLGGGKDDNAGVDNYLIGWDMFNDPDEVYVNLLFAGGASNESIEDASTIQKYISNSVADVRRDCLAWLSVPIDLVVGIAQVNDAVENVFGWRTGFYTGGDAAEFNCNIDTSFTAIEGNAKYQVDKYNDKKRWVGTSADCAGLCALTDVLANVWDSPAGFDRGQVKGFEKLAYNTKRSHRDKLYPIGINNIVNFPDRGFVLFGDRTSKMDNSPFSYINVRRLFNLLEKAIGDSAKNKLFQNNTPFTRRSFVLETNSYLAVIKGRGGVINYQTWCDENNNTTAVISAGEFVGTIFIEAPRSIQAITLNFVATESGANFQELLVAPI